MYNLFKKFLVKYLTVHGFVFLHLFSVHFVHLSYSRDALTDSCEMNRLRLRFKMLCTFVSKNRWRWGRDGDEFTNSDDVLGR